MEDKSGKSPSESGQHSQQIKYGWKFIVAVKIMSQCNMSFTLLSKVCIVTLLVIAELESTVELLFQKMTSQGSYLLPRFAQEIPMPLLVHLLQFVNILSKYNLSMKLLMKLL